MNLKNMFLGSTMVAGALATSGCGGSGSSAGSTPPPASAAPAPLPNPSPTPTPVTTPAPAPAAPRPNINYDTGEYRNSVGAVSMNAITAYQAGATGNGVVAGIVDTGIDLESQEFGDRLLAASRNVAGGASVDDVSGHGTAVAFTLAGRRNDTGSHGVAFDAQLFVARGDTPGSCMQEMAGSASDGCLFSESAIAAGVDAARNAGARVINLSLGGDAAGNQVRQALARATAAGIIVVISAGNDGKADPDGFSLPALDAAVSKGLIIIAGSVDSSDRISNFSNRAGTGAAHYLTAVGEGVRAPGAEGMPLLWSGTSFSAPQIAGAVALLAQAFPNLTGKQIVELLFRTARDAGAAGIDSVYGNGVLDLTEAFRPQGTMAVAGTGATASTSVNATLSAPMGDAMTGSLQTLILDSYDRAFTMEIGGTVRSAAPRTMLASALTDGYRTLGAGNGRIGIAVTVAPGASDTAWQPLSLGIDEATRARGMAASIATRLSENLSFAIATSQSGTALAAGLAGASQPAFLIAADPTQSSGFAAAADVSAAIRRTFGQWGVSAAMERGSALDRAPEPMEAARGRWDRYGYYRSTLAVDRAFGAVRTSAALTRLDESESVLGAHFNGSLGGARAVTWFADIGARADLGDGWSLGASARQGWTRASLTAGIAGGGAIRTTGYAFDIGRRDVAVAGDRLALRISQPLRVASGGLDLSLPVAWDYKSSSVSAFRVQRLNLAPQGREVDAELGYARPLGEGQVSGNVFYRRDPGNIAALSDDYGVALRFSTGF
ncbi:S8 family peptidase [Stakelama pacifica]|uniref:Subtilisin family serine protease n=1 Tax=Stakelama pacifica TaxID=517720 RepID=A0A4R6FUF1_9SPHN|nr:S8 family peptidase [Stakelama pacifica]TDN85496.1 subtilisin family serine protease [Stakelama pacifica]